MIARMVTAGFVAVLVGAAAAQAPTAQAPTAQAPTAQAPTAQALNAQALNAQGLNAQGRFEAWREGFSVQARAKGYDPLLVERFVASLERVERVEELAANQPEFNRAIWDYLAGAVSQRRIDQGRDRLATQAELFDRLEQRYGVDREIVAAVWGVESSYGAIMGRFDVPDGLATLAYQGRRAAFGERELFAVLDILASGAAAREQLRGSWSGAMGHTQFIPSTYVAHAVDWNGDGRKDLWGDPADALASTANYLREAGWRLNEPWAIEVRLPAGFDLTRADDAWRPIGEWAGLGVQRVDGAPWSGAQTGWSARLMQPAGRFGPSILALRNFEVIKEYNRSEAYAMAIGLLGDALEGKPGLQTPWPSHLATLQPASARQLQAGLNTLGYDAGEPDGKIGPRTRNALRAFQIARGLPADGFATTDVLAAVTSAAALVKAPGLAGTAPAPSPQQP